MSAGYAPPEVPLYGTTDVRDEEYHAAEREGRPFFGIERYEEGYAVTYDLFPADRQLSEPATAELDEQVTREVEPIVGDDSLPTTEVTRSIGNSLGQVSLFVREETARQVAATVSSIVLEEDNWVPAEPPGDVAGAEFRRND